MEKIRVLIVEDELIIASHIEQVLIEGGFEVSDIVTKGELVPAAINDKNPDLVLMDINLAGQLDGIETAKIIYQTSRVPVIFLTSNHDEVNFENSKSAMPYAFLKKPFKEEDLLRNIELIANRITFEKKEIATDSHNGIQSQELIKESIFVRHKDKMVKLSIHDILFVEAERNYCNVKTKSKAFTLSLPLKAFEEKVEADCFVRTHRSFLANLSMIDGFDEFHLFFGDHRVPMSKTYKQEIIKRLTIV